MIQGGDVLPALALLWEEIAFSVLYLNFSLAGPCCAATAADAGHYLADENQMNARPHPGPRTEIPIPNRDQGEGESASGFGRYERTQFPSRFWSDDQLGGDGQRDAGIFKALGIVVSSPGGEDKR